MQKNNSILDSREFRNFATSQVKLEHSERSERIDPPASPLDGALRETDDRIKIDPKRKSSVGTNRICALVNEERVFAHAIRILNIAPETLYTCIMGKPPHKNTNGRTYRASGVERTRMVTAYICSLYPGHFYFYRGVWDDRREVTQKRARAMLQDILHKNKSIFLGLAGPDFFEYYPELRAKLREANPEDPRIAI